jgi:NAD(P)-dependent dehydrogenase (short-subunit alcohol dehydrogenase family)
MATEVGRILLLGATGGIGAALARRLKARGTEPALVARDAARVRALAAELDAPWFAADAADPAGLRDAVAMAGRPLDGLAVCVGSIPLKPLARTTEADFLDAFRLNALLPALAAQGAAAALAEGGRGAVVLFSSVAARAGFPNHAAIAAAKAAVEGLTVALAAELAPHVRVNCIAPSLTRTPLAEPLTRNAAMAEAIARQHPIPRLGEPEDAAALADFLLSAQAGWITGQVFGVDGGRSSLRGKG